MRGGKTSYTREAWLVFKCVHSISVKKSPGADVTCSLPRHWSTSKEPNVVLSFPGPKQPSQTDSANSGDMANGVEEELSAEEASFSDQPVFFR